MRTRDGEVVEAAATVFARRGYAAATVQDVADELGILKGSLYYYIATKEDLLYRVLTRIHEQADAILAEAVRAPDSSPLDQLLGYFRAQLAWNVRNPGKVSIYYRDMGQLSEARLVEIQSRRRVLERQIIGIIGRAQRVGEVRTAFSAEMLATFLFAVMIWPHRWFGRGGSMSIEQLAAECSEFVCSGITRFAGDR